MKKIVGAGPERVGDLLGQQLGASRVGCPGRGVGGTSGAQNRRGRSLGQARGGASESESGYERVGECGLVRVSARAGEYECVYIAGAQGVLLYGDLAAPNVCVRSAGQVAGGGPCTRAGGLCIPTGLCLEAAAGAAALRPTFNHWAWFSVSPSLVWRRHVHSKPCALRSAFH